MQLEIFFKEREEKRRKKEKQGGKKREWLRGTPRGIPITGAASSPLPRPRFCRLGRGRLMPTHNYTVGTPPPADSLWGTLTWHMIWPRPALSSPQDLGFLSLPIHSLLVYLMEEMPYNQGAVGLEAGSALACYITLDDNAVIANICWTLTMSQSFF